ncbi:MAG: LuxR C-terminal-related transcriptional regulator [Candidatus Kapaibacterium sp.]
MSQTHAIPKKTLEDVETELRNAKHAKRKFDVTMELCRYMRKDVPRMQTLAESALQLTESHPELGLIRKARAAWWIGFSFRLQNKFESALQMFQLAFKYHTQASITDTKDFNEIEIDTYLMELVDNIAIVQFHLGNIEQAMANFYHNLQLCEKHQVTGGIIASNNSLGEVWRNAGNIAKAYIHWNTALNTSFRTNDLRRIAELYSNLSSVHEYYGENDKALELINKAVLHAKEYKNEYGTCMSLLNRARIYNCNKDWEKSQLDIEECMAIAEEFHIGIITIQAYISLAETYYSQGDIPNTILQYTHAITLAKETNEKSTIAQCTFSLADCYHKLKQNTESIINAKISYDIALSINSTALAASALQLLADVEQEQGNITECNNYLRKYIAIKEQIHQEQHTNEVREARMRLSLENAELERQELAKKTLELERNLNEKSAELSALALSISQKNSVIEKLSKKIEELSTTPNQSYTERCKSMIHEIEILKNSGEEQWTTLQKQFEGFDNGFQTRLLHQFNSLTGKEMKICLLTRLNLSSKDIANILWTSPRTIETHRYSIRKKLNLNKEENLYSFLVKV